MQKKSWRSILDLECLPFFVCVLLEQRDILFEICTILDDPSGRGILL